MPTPSQKDAIEVAVRQHLAELQHALEPITDLLLMRALKERGIGMSKKTFYKYAPPLLKEGEPSDRATQLRWDIEHAKKQQRKRANLSPADRKEERLARQWEEVEGLRDANRSLLLEKAAFVEALKLEGIPVDVIARASAATLRRVVNSRPFQRRVR